MRSPAMVFSYFAHDLSHSRKFFLILTLDLVWPLVPTHPEADFSGKDVGGLFQVGIQSVRRSAISRKVMPTLASGAVIDSLSIDP